MSTCLFLNPIKFGSQLYAVSRFKLVGYSEGHPSECGECAWTHASADMLQFADRMASLGLLRQFDVETCHFLSIDQIKNIQYLK